MKKRNFIMLAMVGLCAGLVMGACRDGGEQPKAAPQQEMMMSPETKTYYDSLSVESKKKFDKMDARHRQAAMEMGGDVNKSVEMQFNDQMKAKEAAKPAPEKK